MEDVKSSLQSIAIGSPTALSQTSPSVDSKAGEVFSFVVKEKGSASESPSLKTNASWSFSTSLVWVKTKILNIASSILPRVFSAAPSSQSQEAPPTESASTVKPPIRDSIMQRLSRASSYSFQGLAKLLPKEDPIVSFEKTSS